MKMIDNIQAVSNYILAKRDEHEEKTAGGIFLPTEHMNNKLEIGTVLRVGNKVEVVKEGDRIFIPQAAGRPINLEGVDFVILLEDEVMLTVSD